MLETEHQEMIRQVRWRYRRRVAFLINVGLFTSLFVFYIFLPPWQRGGIPVELLAVWGVLLMVHFGWLLLAGARDRAIQREIKQARAARVVTYNDHRAYDRLSDDDGDELMELDAEYITKRKRR